MALRPVSFPWALAKSSAGEMWQAHIAAVVSWYASLSLDPATKAHAWHMVNVMARRHPEFYADLPSLLTAEVQRRKDESSNRS